MHFYVYILCTAETIHLFPQNLVYISNTKLYSVSSKLHLTYRWGPSNFEINILLKYYLGRYDKPPNLVETICSQNRSEFFDVFTCVETHPTSTVVDRGFTSA